MKHFFFKKVKYERSNTKREGTWYGNVWKLIIKFKEMQRLHFQINLLCPTCRRKQTKTATHSTKRTVWMVRIITMKSSHFSASLALCEWNPLVTVDSAHKAWTLLHVTRQHSFPSNFNGEILTWIGHWMVEDDTNSDCFQMNTHILSPMTPMPNYRGIEMFLEQKQWTDCSIFAPMRIIC